MKSKAHRIEIPTPYVVGPVNAYLLVGDAVVLIDTGPRTPEAGEILRARLSGAGVALRDVDAILMTHAHLDHFGMAARVKEWTGAPLHAHEADRVYLEKFPESHNRIVGKLRAYARRYGMPGEVFDRVASEYDETLPLGEAVGVDRTYREGEPVTFGSLSLEPVFTPGHTAGSTCLLERSSRRLFSGDTILEQITPVSFIRGRRSDHGLRRFEESLRTLRGLEADRIHPGHGRVFRDLQKGIDRIERHIEIRRKRVLDALAEGAEKSADEVARYAFGERREDVERWIGWVETLGVLEALVEEGAVREIEQGGRCLFRQE